MVQNFRYIYYLLQTRSLLLIILVYLHSYSIQQNSSQTLLLSMSKIYLSNYYWALFFLFRVYTNRLKCIWNKLKCSSRYVECTASSIQALVLFKKLYPGHRTKEIDNFITNAATYLENDQKPDGSWYINLLKLWSCK